MNLNYLYNYNTPFLDFGFMVLFELKTGLYQKLIVTVYSFLI